MPVDMKLLIAETFGKLAQRGNIDKITVKALIEECHISRQTFYYHFQDIMDVLEWSVRRQTQALLEQSLAEKDLHSALQIFISFTVQQFPLLQKLMNSQRRPMFEKLMTGALETYLTELCSTTGGMYRSTRSTGTCCCNTMSAGWRAPCLPSAAGPTWTRTGWPGSWKPARA